MPRRTYVERQALRHFNRRRYRPVVTPAVDFGGNAAGEIDYQYRDLLIHLETEKFYAVADIGRGAARSETWQFHDVIKTLTGVSPGYITPWKLGELLATHYDEILGLLSAVEGPRRLDETVAAREAAEAADWARATDTSPAANAERARKHAAFLVDYRSRQRAALVWKAPLFIAVLGLFVALWVWWTFFAHFD